MKVAAAATTLVAILMLAACGKSEPPKAAPAAPAAAPAAAKTEAKKEEKQEAPDAHGMPGMSELFKDDEKKDAKPAEKPAEKK